MKDRRSFEGVMEYWGKRIKQARERWMIMSIINREIKKKLH